MRPLALTMGDPAGIGPDITLMAWQRHQATKRSSPLPVFVTIGSVETLAKRAKQLGLSVPLETVLPEDDVTGLFTKALPVIPLKLAEPVTAGQSSVANAQAVVASIERAVDLTAKGLMSGVVTNPIAKATLYAANFKHPGHTEYLGELAKLCWPSCEPNPVMMLAAHNILRVVPVTIHVALSQVVETLTADLLEKVIVTADEALRRDFGLATPMLAVTGLNPHAGEQGALGREEREIIIPVLKSLRAQGLSVSGPHPADTMFHEEARVGYDAAVAMYHDQALVPLKTLAFDRGVNITLGLPFVRTSPDHGTAFDIAGTGQARPTSLIESLFMAARMIKQRAQGAQ